MGHEVVKEVNRYQFLWDGSRSGWGLVSLGPEADGETDSYVIVNRISHAVLTIEDNEVFDAVVERMLREGSS